MAYDGTKPEYQGPLSSQPIRDNFVALRAQIDVEHNADGTHKDALKASGGTSTGDINIKKSVPAVRLIGTEASAADIRLVESAGSFYVQKNTGTEAVPAWNTLLKLDGSTLVITGAKIDQTNFTPETAIPDTKLSQIVTAGKIALSALPSNVVTSDTVQNFTQSPSITGANPFLKLDNTGDGTYYANLTKTSTTGQFLLQIKRKSDGVAVANVQVWADGNLISQTVTAGGQLVSQVAAGTPPLSVASTTRVPNLNATWAGWADGASYADRAIRFSDVAPGECIVAGGGTVASQPLDSPYAWWVTTQRYIGIPAAGTYRVTWLQQGIAYRASDDALLAVNTVSQLLINGAAASSEFLSTAGAGLVTRSVDVFVPYGATVELRVYHAGWNYAAAPYASSLTLKCDRYLSFIKSL